MPCWMLHRLWAPARLLPVAPAPQMRVPRTRCVAYMFMHAKEQWEDGMSRGGSWPAASRRIDDACLAGLHHCVLPPDRSRLVIYMAQKNFYAVRVGRKPGIYRDW